MLILFQHKIIYMPFIPPFARSERIADYAQQCKPATWRTEWIRARDGTHLAMAVSSMEQKAAIEGNDGRVPRGNRLQDVVVLYLHGFALVVLLAALLTA